MDTKTFTSRPTIGNENKVELNPNDSTLLGHGIKNSLWEELSKKDWHKTSDGYMKYLPNNSKPALRIDDALSRDNLISADDLDQLNLFYKANQAKIEAGVESVKKAKIQDEIENNRHYNGTGINHGFDNSAWIQTHSGRRFNPTNPNPEAIVIQDIAHALSMQCRFAGHCHHFMSVAQHSVMVSYFCDKADRLWGLLHDASEAYLVDVPSPLKKSGKFESYLEFEKKMQQAICQRFELSLEEPISVKEADIMVLATEARDLMINLRSDWVLPVNPLPFKIEPWDHQKAKDMFMKRFFELTAEKDWKSHYDHYLRYKDII